MADLDALFHRAGDVYTPTALTTGPWSGDAQHAGPVAALVGGALEAAGDGASMRVARLTLELLRSLPLRPHRLEVDEPVGGRNVDRVAARLLDAGSGATLVTAVALRIRLEHVDIPAAGDGETPPPSPDASEPLVMPIAGTFFGTHGVEMRVASGSARDPGRAAVWFRLRHPVVAGEAVTPLQRVAAAADFGNGVSAVADFKRLLFINPDLTIGLHRPPDGEWVCLDAVSRLEGDGVGGAEAALWDERGRIGRSYQTLLVRAR